MSAEAAAGQATAVQMPVYLIAGMPHRMRVRAAEATSGFIMLEVEVPPGAGVPPHTHTQEDEAFVVLSGRVAFRLDRAAPQVLEAGGSLLSPRGHEHGFRNIGDVPASLLIVVSPGAGCERMFAELDLAGASMTAGDRDALAQMMFPICARYGVTFAPLPD